MAPNAGNGYFKCLQYAVGIIEDFHKQVAIKHCFECNAYLQPQRTWIKTPVELNELLTFCVDRLKNLNKFRNGDMFRHAAMDIIAIFSEKVWMITFGDDKLARISLLFYLVRGKTLTHVHPLQLVIEAAPVWPNDKPSPVKDGGNETYQRLLRSELFGSDFDSFGSPAGGGGHVASPISPSKNILRFKTEHSGPNSPYSPSRCTAPTSPGSSPPPPTTPTVSSPPPPKTPSTPTTTKSPPPPKSPSTTPSTSPSSSSLDTRVIVGIAIGAIAILVVLSLYCIFCSKKKKRRREEPGYYVPPPTGPK
ncbi:hypothetical protein ACLB2K_017416 [Fragaria x ananassa]